MIFRALGGLLGTRALAGFLVSGFLLSLLGALLPVWGYDVSSDYSTAGHYFLAVVSGMIVAALLVRRVSPRPGTRTLLVIGCSAGAFGLVGLAFAPDRPLWRAGGLLAVGLAGGLLHTGLFEAALPAWDRSPTAAVITAGIFFGLGSMVAPLVVAGTYYAYSVGTILCILAAVPAVFIAIFARHRYPEIAAMAPSEAHSQFRSGAALLSSLLLFFQFGNEWSIAGWLPLFLIHHIGVSPESALAFLAVYFAALTLGRVALYYLVPRVPHRRLLGVSAATPILGCVLLSVTNNRFGATVAIFLIGLGFAAIYPLVAAWIGRRFPNYHPGFFNGLFSVALVGGMLAPWALGELAALVGIQWIMVIPSAGTCMVMLLLWLIWVESRVTGP